MARASKADFAEANVRLAKKVKTQASKIRSLEKRLEFYMGLDAGHRANHHSICGKTCKSCSFGLGIKDNKTDLICRKHHPKGFVLLLNNPACGDYVPEEC